MNKKYNRIIKSSLVALFVVIGLSFGKYCEASSINLNDNIEDYDVENYSSYSTDTIYQIVTDRFFDGDSTNNPTGAIFDKNNNRKYHGGDWKGITNKITNGYLTGLNISAIWISSPIENINTIDPSNQSAAYHGYWGKDFFKTNQYFGSVNDFSEMINTAHQNGIKVIIDFAPNHTSSAENGTIVFPEDGALYKNGSIIGSFTNDTNKIFNHESWTDFSTLENGIYHSMYGLADLNQMNNTVDEYLKDAIDLWLDLGVDGIRVDAVKHMPMGWQTNWLNSVYSNKPVFTFGEWFCGGTNSDNEFNLFTNESGMSLLDFRLANGIRNTFGSNTSTMRDLYNVVQATEIDFKEPNDQVTFIDNHDMSRFMTLANDQSSVDLSYVFMLTSRGVPTIYYGSEQYATGVQDPDNRGDMPSFSTNTRAYNIIKSLATLRKQNPALAYGNTVERWINDDVLVYERSFGANKALIAINKSYSNGYNISGAEISVPAGVYPDKLNNLCGGGNLTVVNGTIGDYLLAPRQAAVWSYVDDNVVAPLIGNIDPLVGVSGNTVTITGRGFGNTLGSVKFGNTNCEIIAWSDSLIKFKIPNISAGYYEVTVTNSQGLSTSNYESFKVLSGNQTAIRFIVNNAYTELGQSVYIVGNCLELGNWNPTNAVGPFFNSTASIASYPSWFYDLSLPTGFNLEYKFIKKDTNGNVIWEGGNNHIHMTSQISTETIINNFQSY